MFQIAVICAALGVLAVAIVMIFRELGRSRNIVENDVARAREGRDCAEGGRRVIASRTGRSSRSCRKRIRT